MPSLTYLLFSFLSSFGDAIFLAGIPLFLYQESGNVLDTVYVPVIISLTVLLTRNQIVRLNKLNPLRITAYGELLMALIEVLTLAIYTFICPSKWVILGGLFPLAVVYNFFAPTKFFKLQDYFFKKENAFLGTSIQGALSKVGMLFAVFASGWILVKWDIRVILLVDIASFLLFSFFIFMNLKKTPKESDENNSNIREDATSRRITMLGLACLSVTFLITTWETSSSIALAAKSLGVGIDTASTVRVLFNSLGLLLGLLVAKYLKNTRNVFWFSTVLLLTIGVSLVASIQIDFSIYLFFAMSGVLSTLTLPTQRLFYHSVTKLGGDASRVMSLQWIFNSVLILFLLPIGLASDSGVLHFFSPLQTSLTLMTFVRALGGILFVYSVRNSLGR